MTFASLETHTHLLGSRLLEDASALTAYAAQAEAGTALRKRARELHDEMLARKKRRTTLGRALRGETAPSVSAREVIEAQCSVTAETVQHLSAYEAIAASLSYAALGIALFVRYDGALGLEFQPSFGGQRVETYRLVLTRRAQSPSLCLGEHSLPYFVPLAAISSRYLNMSLQRFASTVHAYLAAFVARREQVRAVEARCSALCVTSRTVPVDKVELTVVHHKRTYALALVYDLARARPTHATVSLVQAVLSRKRAAWLDAMERRLLSEPLDAVLQATFPSCFADS